MFTKPEKEAVAEKRHSAASALQSFCLDGSDGCNLPSHLLLKGSGREGPGLQLSGNRHFLQVVAKLHYNRFGTNVSLRALSPGEIRVGPIEIRQWEKSTASSKGL